MRSFITPVGLRSLLQHLEEYGERKAIVEVREPNRDLIRNAALHACITDVAKQMKWHGEYYDIEDWKRLLTAAWMRATDRKIKLIPAIDGSGVDVLYQRTSRLSNSEVRELIQYIYAFGVEHGVVFKEPTPEGWQYPVKAQS